MASGSGCGHWNEIKSAPCKPDFKLGSDCNFSRQRSVKRKLERLNLKCNISCISAEDDAEEDIASKDITECMHCYLQWNDSCTQPIKESRKFTYFGELPNKLVSETSTEQVNGRACVSLTLPEEKEVLNSFHSNAHYSSPTPIVDHISPKKFLMEKKRTSRNVPDREAESCIHMIEVEKEVGTLREALRGQHQALRDLYTELEEERNASSTAANEALSMILRLQAEKAAVRLEANQYKRLAEEKIAHDQESLAFFEELIYRKDNEIDALECERQACRHRLLSIGFDDLEIGKIRWLERSFSNDRDGDRDSRISLEQEGFDGYDSLGWKTPNNTNSRDLWKIQDKKGKRHTCKNDDMCNDGINAVDSCQPQIEWGELRSKGVTHGQDRVTGNFNRIQLEENSVSRNVIKESIRGYSNNMSDNYASQRMEIDCKLQQGFEDSGVEPSFTTHSLIVQGATHEVVMNTPENSPRGNSLTLWEHIEKLEDRLQQLSRRRGLNYRLDEEWVSTNRELQKTVVAYTASLREGARSHWRLSLDHTAMYDGLMGESSVQSAERSQFTNVCEISEGVKLAKADSEVPFSEKNATNLKVAADESDTSFNLHDVYVIQQECQRNGEFTSHKGHALKFDLEDGDRLGKPDPLPQKHQGCSYFQDPSLTVRELLQSLLHNVHQSNASDSFCNAVLGVPMESMLDSSPVQEEVKHLSMRLQTLEEDREFMKQAINSLKRDREELSLLKEIAQQLREIKSPLKSCKDVKSPPPQEDASVVRFMKGILSFRSHMNNVCFTNMDVASCNSVGLSHLLEKTPLRKMSSHITRAVKVYSFTDVRNGHEDKASET